ncbi:hypothetical protein QA649_37060 [Bradyrhizobium sp. CB1717]|uniref:hypothetical protein n=1 Tax=Bradyrhizobium sp. CB1717 TaxID=3039154 RepID=UPI0024B0BE7B|nr:hypothetical protein [Bradyrhizobium sp. CB1717]WFU23572.1 hypothetical protein QA649_37060 [Bradyrhizobium sp. CB1717]
MVGETLAAQLSETQVVVALEHCGRNRARAESDEVQDGGFAFHQGRLREVGAFVFIKKYGKIVLSVTFDLTPLSASVPEDVRDAGQRRRKSSIQASRGPAQIRNASHRPASI